MHESTQARKEGKMILAERAKENEKQLKGQMTVFYFSFAIARLLSIDQQNLNKH
jgi:hypothetical protein